MPAEPKLNRRDWLRKAVGLSVCAGGAAVGGPWLKDLAESKAEDPQRFLLRPPGAQNEGGFLADCIRCGLCVEVCPFDTLMLAGPLEGLSTGTPFLDSRRMPCRLCEGEDELLCIEVCPTEALQIPGGEEYIGDQVRAIRMGVARIDTDLCMAWHDQVCRACWHACPYPDEAILLDELGRAYVVDEACIGCGLCDWACLTEPTSIFMVPCDTPQQDA